MGQSWIHGVWWCVKSSMSMLVYWRVSNITQQHRKKWHFTSFHHGWLTSSGYGTLQPPTTHEPSSCRCGDGCRASRGGRGGCRLGINKNGRNGSTWEINMGIYQPNLVVFMMISTEILVTMDWSVSLPWIPTACQQQKTHGRNGVLASPMSENCQVDWINIPKIKIMVY